jgi:hypothetical protein
VKRAAVKSAEATPATAEATVTTSTAEGIAMTKTEVDLGWI